MSGGAGIPDRNAEVNDMRKTICLLLLMALLLPGILTAEASEPGPTEIYTPEELQAMGENPAGMYVLMNDLNMTGVEWTPVDLNGGSFDGNGYAILNLTVHCTGDTTDISYDGNRKEYDTSFAGFFGVLRNANVCNLNLVNIRARVESDTPCFLGSFAGAMYDSTITDCSVSGCLELRAHDRMFGVGGMVGYGSGVLERCRADMTLICTDTGVDTLDEQFLGGAYATGFIDVMDCEIILDGYASEYGYAHNGGIIGMVMQYPLGNDRTGYLTGNTVTGKITFFEKNEDPRAYCEAYVGETLASAYSRKNNHADFIRDQRSGSSPELRPGMCEDSVYTEQMVAPGCESFGYCEYTCQTCGYTYTDRYTLPAHTVTQWTVTREATVEQEGISTGYCDGCGEEFTITLPKLEPVPTTQAPTEPVPATEAPDVPEDTPEKKPVYLLTVAGTAFVLLVIGLICLPKTKGKYQK